MSRAGVVRSVTEADDFGEDMVDQVLASWESGESRPEWCFVLERRDERIGRIGYRVTETCPPEYLGDLPPMELFGFGWQMRWEEAEDDMRLLLSESLRQVGAAFPQILEIRIQKELHDRPDRRVEVLLSMGWELFQEKAGYLWMREDQVAPPSPARLRFVTLAEVGDEMYEDVMARCGQGTLDRNDRYYWRLAGAANWAAVMMGYAGPDDRERWLLGLEAGEPVGYVGVSAFDEQDTATIAHIGVVPAFRGMGYVNDLLTAGTAAARDAGFAAILSDVDTLNAPMRKAMIRAGHLPDRRPWHVWAFRAAVSDLT